MRLQVSALPLMFSLVCLLPLGGAQAQTTAVPGRSVGRVFLGMERADVWKILQKPNLTLTMPYGMSLYGEDYWDGAHGTLTVVSERDKVIQIEFDSPNFTTTNGLSTKSTLAQIHRRHPSMTVRGYLYLFPKPDFDHHSDEYIIDDVHEGIAFVNESQEYVVPDDFNAPPALIIIHRPGYRAVPIGGDVQVRPMALSEHRNSLRLLRSWFTPRKGN